MTSLALIIGLLPMMFADGAGANGNNALGTRFNRRYAYRYDSAGTHRSALFVTFQIIQEKISPLKWEDTDNTGIESEIEQYSRS